MSSSVDSDNLSQAPTEPPRRESSRRPKERASSRESSLPSTLSSSEGSDDGNPTESAPVRRRKRPSKGNSSRAPSPSSSRSADDEGWDDDRYYQNPPSNNNDGSQLNVGNALLSGAASGFGAALGANLFGSILAPPTTYVYNSAPSIVQSTTYRPMSRRTSIHFW